MDCASAELCKCRERDARDAHFVHERDRQRSFAPPPTRCGGHRADRRIGTAFLFPASATAAAVSEGRQAIIKFSADKNRFRVLEEVQAVNASQKVRLLGKMDKAFGESLRGKTIAVWGLAFKPRTDDMRKRRGSVDQGLLERGAKVRAYDGSADVANVFEKDLLRTKRLRRGQGCRRAPARDRVEQFREPDFKRVSA